MGGVLNRVLGPASRHFELDLFPSDNGFDFFEVEAGSGRVKIEGSSPVALCRGVYHYLRQTHLGQVSWSGAPIRLPALLPDYPVNRIESPITMRHYLSVCTYGYSAAWWDWPRWEQELDWMALHGINFPLLLEGTEAISRRVFRKIGLTEEEIAAHFSGPAHLCWHRLGNLNGHMGPLPESWIESQEALQKKILLRARALGMTPIVPGFSGFVPPALRRIWPEVQLQSAEPWAGFTQTTYLDPRSPSFQEVGRLFLEEYRCAYGPVHHYLCELFAEQVPRLAPEMELEGLREIGRATWQTLVSVDLEANWVIQGWPFYFARDYWQPEKTAALLDAAPAGRLFVLDLATEELETWRTQPTMREKGWMFNVVHNYGQNTHLHGDLQGFVDRAASAVADSGRGLLQGMGISPEGIDQNPVVYELLTDLIWDPKPVSLDSWLKEYAHARYGGTGAEQAWEILAKSIYGKNQSVHYRYSWRFRPGDQPLVASPDPNQLKAALEALLSQEHLYSSPNFRRDVVDVAKTWLGAVADRLLEQSRRTEFEEALVDLDTLLATLPEHRLSTWLRGARDLGWNDMERRHYEHNARSLITWWGGPFLFDYATREWAGLIRDFHIPRWKMWFDWRDGSRPAPDFAQWEKAWSERGTPPEESVPGDGIPTAQKLFAKYRQRNLSSDPPSSVIRLEPQPAKAGRIELDLGKSKQIYAAACVPIFGQGLRARYHAEISPDGATWHRVDRAETCRGIRVRLEQPARHIRFWVETLHGSDEQLFQVVLFEPA